MKRLIASAPLFLAAALILAACSTPTAAPAAPAAAPATEAAAAANNNKEAPPVVPASTAAEATEAAATGTHVYKVVPDQSEAGYSVKEEFFGQGFETAVGSTNAVNGQVALQFDNNSVKVADNQFTVDISTLKTDRPRRDQAIRDRWLESSKFPTATFVAKDVTDLPADAALGKDVSFKLSGDLTIRDVTKPVTWDMTAKVDGNTLTGSGATSLLMKDFGFDPPDIAGMLKVTDGVSVTIKFVAQAAQ